MNILCIDTSQQALTVGVVYGEHQYFHHQPDAKLKHSHTFMDAVMQVLSQSGLQLSDIDAFLAVVGPGSFTGIRIGITATRAFSQIMDKPCIAVNSLRVFAYNVKSCKKYTVPLIDAMQNKFYYSVFDTATGEELHAPDVCLQQDIVTHLGDKYGIVRGDIQFVYSEPPQVLQNITVAPCYFPDNLAKIAKIMVDSGEFLHYEQLIPLYAAEFVGGGKPKCK